MKISMIGCGYLGAVHAAAMASIGHDVTAVDTDHRKIETLASGESPFFEPGLNEMLREGLISKRLRFTTSVEEVRGSSVHFLGVGTPQLRGSDSADLRHVIAAVDALLPNVSPGDIVAGKSTVPVGTAASIADRISTAGAELVWNPEFLREGRAVQDAIFPDRIVLGVGSSEQSERIRDVFERVYHSSAANGTPFIVTNFATAELAKGAANAFLATKISFINAMSEIAEATGADVTQLADVLGHDHRIGRRFLNAGIGFGGGCLPKDIRAFAARAEDLGAGESVTFLREVDTINSRQRDRVVRIVVDEFGGDVTRRKIALLGAAFKPNSDDVRDSPGLDVAAKLRQLGAEVVVTDPAALANASLSVPQVQYAPTFDAAVGGANAIILATEWDEYRNLDPVRVASLTPARLIIDGRNCLDSAEWRTHGWVYRGIGRP